MGGWGRGSAARLSQTLLLMGSLSASLPPCEQPEQSILFRKSHPPPHSKGLSHPHNPPLQGPSTTTPSRSSSSTASRPAAPSASPAAACRWGVRGWGGGGMDAGLWWQWSPGGSSVPLHLPAPPPPPPPTHPQLPGQAGVRLITSAAAAPPPPPPPALLCCTQVTQLGHVKDLATAFVKILGNPKAARQVYNVAGERCVRPGGSSAGQLGSLLLRRALLCCWSSHHAAAHGASQKCPGLQQGMPAQLWLLPASTSPPSRSPSPPRPPLQLRHR